MVQVLLVLTFFNCIHIGVQILFLNIVPNIHMSLSALNQEIQFRVLDSYWSTIYRIGIGPHHVSVPTHVTLAYTVVPLTGGFFF